MPSRGALGNGLRVVAGAVIASEGTLTVTTRNRRISLRPERDGSTTVLVVEDVEHPIGTRIEIGFGLALPTDDDTLDWAHAACAMASHGTLYQGKSSPHWYDAVQFRELLYIAGDRPVREFISRLDGCSGGKAGEIVDEVNLDRVRCNEVTLHQARTLLVAAREATRPVQPKRLGAVGEGYARTCAYGYGTGFVQTGTEEPCAEIPYVAEAWARRIPGARKSLIDAFVNRTPVTGQVWTSRDGRDVDMSGCNLYHTIAAAPKDQQFLIHVNITTPYMPITSDGKEPNFEPFFDGIAKAAGAAVRKAIRPNSNDRRFQNDVVLDNLDDAIEAQGGMRFNQRQLFYFLRPIVMEEIGEDLKLGNFKQIIDDYEAENDEIPLMYREARGSIYHLHLHETITLGTLMVED
jgi:hypothetical protein